MEKKEQSQWAEEIVNSLITGVRPDGGDDLRAAAQEPVLATLKERLAEGGTTPEQVRLLEALDRFLKSPARPPCDLGDAATILQLSRERVTELAFDRLRKIEAETGQLRWIVENGPTLKRTDLQAEEQLVLEHIRRGNTGTASQIAKDTKLSTRINPVLARLAKQGLVEAQGTGRKAVWGLGPSDPGYKPAPATTEPTTPAAPVPVVVTSPLATTESPVTTAVAAAAPPAPPAETPAKARGSEKTPAAAAPAAAARPTPPNTPRPSKPDEGWT